MKKIFYASLLFSTIIILSTAGVKSVQNSGAAPAGNTGATGSYCNGCHSGNTFNAAGGSVVANGLPTAYSLSTAYNFSVAISHATANRKRFGFAMKAVDANGNAIGTFTTTNANAGVGSGEIRHSSAPSSPTGISTYTYANLKWTAPATNNLANKNVRFFLVGVAGDGSGNGGDFVYSNLTTASIAPFIKSFTPNKGTNGTIVTIKGGSFTGATAVSFGGVAAQTFSVQNDSTVAALVDVGATGSVSVTTPNGTATLAGFTYCAASTTQNFNLSGCNSVVYNGKTYTSSTIVKDTLKTVAGCDSVRRTANITVKNITPTSQTNNLFGCNSVVYNGKTYTASTIVKDTFRTIVGSCDSVYNTINIVVKNITPIQQNSSPIVCDKFVYKNIVYTSSTTIKDTIKSGDGCDSVYVNINVTINPSVMGRIYHPTKGNIPNVRIQLSGTNSSAFFGSGGYNAACLPAGNNVIIRPSKNNDITKGNGITGLDIIKVQNHVLGKSKITNPYQLIAADVNSSKTINTLDIIAMKKVFLGLDTTFTGNKLWAFVDSAYVFPDTTNPFTFKDSMMFNNIATTKINQSFIGIKLGDVDYSWNPANPRGMYTQPVVVNYSTSKKAKEEIHIKFSKNDLQHFQSFESTIHFDNNVFEFVNIRSSKKFEGLAFNAANANSTGNIALLWINGDNKTEGFKSSEAFFTLILKAKKGVEMNANEVKIDFVNNAYIVDENLQEHTILLERK